MSLKTSFDVPIDGQIVRCTTLAMGIAKHKTLLA